MRRLHLVGSRTNLKRPMVLSMVSLGVSLGTALSLILLSTVAWMVSMRRR
jgi:hypothetical protein